MNEQVLTWFLNLSCHVILIKELQQIVLNIIYHESSFSPQIQDSLVDIDELFALVQIFHEPH